MGRYSGKTCRLSVMLTLTFTFFLVEIVFGYITNSMALVADSFHMLSDVVALIIAFFCMKISKRRSSSKNTFGWVRAEVLGALINAVFLIALCFSIFIEALKRLIEPEPIHDPEKILIVGILGLVVNVIGIFMFHGHASLHGHSHARPVPLNLPLSSPNGVTCQETSGRSINDSSKWNGGAGQTAVMVSNDPESRNGDDDDDEDESAARRLSNTVVAEAHNISFFNRTGDGASKSQKPYSSDLSATALMASDKSKQSHGSSQMNMHGVFLHILGDAFGSVIVIVNAVIYWRVKDETLQKYLDPSLSLVMAIIIFSTTLPLFKESALILLQTVPTHIDVEDIKQKLLKSIDGVLAVHEFHVWRLAGNKIIATAHIRCRDLDEYMKIAESVKQLFHDEGIHSTTIQPEFDEVCAPNVDYCVLECPAQAACAPSMCCQAPLVTSDGTTGMDMHNDVEQRTDVISTDPLPSSADTCINREPDAHSKGSSNCSDEDHSGIPPMLYYNKEYNSVGGAKGEK